MLGKAAGEAANLLDSSTDGAENDSKVHGRWLTPLVDHLIAKRLGLEAGDAWNLLEIGRVLSNEGASFHEIGVIRKVMMLRKFLDLGKKQVTGYSRQGVLDPAKTISSMRDTKAQTCRHTLR